MWLALLATKDEAAAAIIRLQAEAESQSSCKLRTLRTDRGGEFTSGSFTAYCAELGVERHLTAPYSPQQNGVVERRNQTIVGMARSLLKAKRVPDEFWQGDFEKGPTISSPQTANGQVIGIVLRDRKSVV